jgi:hypothetical protein
MRFEAISSIAGGEYYFLHLYAQLRDDLWEAIWHLVRLDYDPNNFESIRLQPNHTREIRGWAMPKFRMRLWFSARRGSDYRIHLSGFRFGASATHTIIGGAVNGTIFNFSRCLFDPNSMMDFSFQLLTMVMTLGNTFDPSLVFMILSNNVEHIIDRK